MTLLRDGLVDPIPPVGHSDPGIVRASVCKILSDVEARLSGEEPSPIGSFEVFPEGRHRVHLSAQSLLPRRGAVNAFHPVAFTPARIALAKALAVLPSVTAF
jgi:hypothetical protein